MHQPSTTSWRRRLLRLTVALGTLLVLAGYLLTQYESGVPGIPKCTVTSAQGDGAAFELDPEQAGNAATIEAVGSSRGMPERAVAIALATALQESALRNISHGDRDSLGLFQQRPSQGWGTARQIMDPVYSAGAFYDHLAKVPDYTRLPLTVAAQRVQRSGFPDAYAKHEPDAELLAAALTGRAPGTLNCTARVTTQAGDPAVVRARLVKEFGAEVLPKIGEAGESVAGAAGSGGGVVRVPVRPTVRDTAGDTEPDGVAAAGSGEAAGSSGDADGSGDGDRARRRGWELAHWAVAHASELRLEEVSYAGRVWRVADSRDGWTSTGDGNGDDGDSSAEGAAVPDTVRIVTAQ
ncbi:heavy metal transporter [Streptomyces sp. GC420]|uniref:heavy metal transporter n=1 Tax=Streptomyces sp. GC420 TaxID=2697568 RepID=UPI0028BE92DB|nr:heavy metal transporter [Streptomyces sp. GC420]